MSERRFWQYLRNCVGNRWHVQRHEDKFSTDIPDLSYGVHCSGGWIELKFLKGWPKNRSTKVKIRHFTAGQRNWLWNRGMTQGNCWVFLRVAEGVNSEFLLFTYRDVHIIDTFTRDELYHLAMRVYHRSIGTYDFLQVLKRGC